MSYSTLTLYYNCKLQPEKNFVLDDANSNPVIEEYLATLTKYTYNNYQYIKHDKAITIKITFSQDALDWLYGEGLNYCKIENLDETPYYYFITGRHWTSSNSIVLDLKLDSLNTLHWGVSYQVTDKSFIKRMHKPRFKNKTAYTHTFKWYIHTDPSEDGYVRKHFYFTNIFFAKCYCTSYHIEINVDESMDVVPVIYGYSIDRNVDPVRLDAELSYEAEEGYSNTIVIDVTAVFRYYERIVDFKSENISAPLYKTYDNILYENKGESQVSWRLYYKNSNDQENSPIDCYLVPKNPVPIKYLTNQRKIDAQDLFGGWTYICNAYNTGGEPIITSLKIRLKIGDSTYICGYQNDEFTIFALRADNIGLNPKTQVYMIRKKMHYKLGDFDYVEVLDNRETLYVWKDETSATEPMYYETFIGMQFWSPNVVPLKALTWEDYQEKDLSSYIDKTLSTNIKIIDLPYCPNTSNIENGRYNIISPWWADDVSSPQVKLKLTDLDSSFDNIVESNEYNMFSEYILPIDPNWNFNERVLDDSKLLHSDFYRYKFVYDSFSKDFHMELLDTDEMQAVDDGVYFRFEFIPSRNIISRFLFKILQARHKISLEDYESILAVSRNNEEVLYNSSYLNYIRNGYNFDLKAKQRNELMAGIGLAGSALGAVGSIAGGIATSNPLAIAGGAMGMFTSLMGYANTIAQGEENIQRKLNESKAQAVAVENADDLDLLYAYSENKAKICKYAISSQMKRVLADIFHYCGYAVDEQLIPNINNRIHFNYVQGDLVINELQATPYDLIEDIKEKFSEGVTFLHIQGNNISTLDFNQEKENLERF